MTNEQRVKTLFAEANPIPDADLFDLDEIGGTAYLATLEARSGEMSTKKIDVETPAPRRPRVRRGLLIGAATVALIIIVGVALAFVTGDGTEVAGSDSRLLQLTFDGEQCTYEGPSVLSAGEIEIVYHNKSSEDIRFRFVRLDEGRTTQDMLDYLADPNSRGPPSWTTGVWGQENVPANSSSIPVMRTVAPGLHTLGCGADFPDNFGGELTVTP